MINKKILAGLVLATVVTTGLSYSFANDTTSTWSSTRNNSDYRHMSIMDNKWFHQWKHWWIDWMHKELTAEEKTALESMTDAQKKVFFDTKMQNEKANMDKEESVIDKLLAWSTLTSDEEIVRQELIKQRAERKVEMQARKTEMDAMKVVFDKKASWQTLTSDEQAKLDKFEANKPNFKKHK